MKKLFMSALALAVALSASSAWAASISFSSPYGPDSVGSAPTSVSLSKFDPSLGTLLSVTLELDATADSGTIVWDNEAGVASTVTLGIGATVTANAPAALTVVAVPLQVGNGSVDASNDVGADFVGSDSFTVTGNVGVDSDSATLNSGLAPYIAAFLGDSFNVTVGSTIQTFLSTSGGFGPIDTTPGATSGLITVTYEYQPVPEPASVVLGLFGVAGLALAVARRRK